MERAAALHEIERVNLVKTDAADAITDRVLTVFNGVSYGFDLDPIPEPALLSLAAFLLTAVILLHRRRFSHSQPGRRKPSLI